MKHLSGYAEPGPKWPAASPQITDRWAPRRWWLWDATTSLSPGPTDTAGISMSCPRPRHPLRSKPGRRVSGPLTASQTGLLSFVHNWLKPLGEPYSQSGSVVCCRRRLQPAPTGSFAPHTPYARCRTARRRYASRSLVLPWLTGLPTTESSQESRTRWAPSITDRHSARFRSRSEEHTSELQSL